MDSEPTDSRRPPLFDLTGMVAIVTGSSQGIGRASAERLVEHGAQVVISSRTLSDCQSRADQINNQYGEERAIAVRCDIAAQSDLTELVDTTMAHWGRIDCLVCNAVVHAEGTSWVERIDVDEFTRAFIGTVSNTLFLTKLVARVMRQQGSGSIVFMASTAGVAALEDFTSYGVSKAALIHLARILAVQLGPSNVRVNAISPGIIASAGLESPQWRSGERQRVVLGPTPFGRPGLPDEIAGCVVWLASPAGSYATGQNFVIDGGQSLKGMHGPHDMFELVRQRLRS